MRTCSSDSHGTVAHGEPASRKWDNPSRKSIQSCCRWLTTMGTACSALRRRANAKVHRVLPRRPLLRYQRTSVGSTPLVGGTIRVRFAELPAAGVGTGGLSRQQGGAQVVPGGRWSTSTCCRRRSRRNAKSGERLLNWGTDGAFYGVCRESLGGAEGQGTPALLQECRPQRRAVDFLAALVDLRNLHGVGDVLERVRVEDDEVGAFTLGKRAEPIGDADPFRRDAGR